ncbi:flagellin [Viridibacillus sp. FSL R5-0477]|uniref:flagellin n=1 Tax=Viridibacillus TaxID=496496 RepID=UPI002E0F290F|nr:flagellin [Viridibacillus arenosi]
MNRLRIQNKAWTTFANNRVQKNQSAITKTLEKLSGGDKIVRASLNASGLSISETMRSQIKGLSRAQQNMQDGLSVLEVTDSGLQSVNVALHRGRELAVQAANDTLTDDDRNAAQKELDQLMESINDTADNLEFNTKRILGEIRPLFIQVGSNADQKLAIDTVDVSTKALGLENANLQTRENADDLISKIDKAIEHISKDLANVGSDYNALTSHHENIGRAEESLQKSESLIRDPDMALEMMDLVKQNIVQKGDELLIQNTNRNVQSILGLFK